MKSGFPEDAPRMPPPRRGRGPALATVAPAEPESPAPSHAASAAPSPAPAAPVAYAVETMRPDVAPEEPRVQPVAAASAGAAEAGVVIVGEGSPAASAQSAASARAVVYVARAGAEPDVNEARTAGAVIVDAPAAQSPGRARNAGYRHLKKLHPDLALVQFLEAGAELDPGWLDVAARFMARRPEVAIVEGVVEIAGAAPAGATDHGELQSAGKSFLVRADVFEAAGGFRGDLIVNETEDLSIRLRRRGAHVWRLAEPMARRQRPRGGFGRWWARAEQAGFAYAHGARLHGAPPERLFVARHLASLIWGAALPFFIVFASVMAAAAAQALAPQLNPLLVLAGVLAAGAAVYAMKIFIAAVMRGPFRVSSWVNAIAATLAHGPEFLGAWRFYVTPAAKRGES